MTAKFNTVVTALGRLAGRRANNSRLLRASATAARAMLSSWRRLLHMLWLQITGVLFCFFALGFATRIPHVYQEYASGKTPNYRFLLLVCVTAMFAWFGASSLWKAARK